jgi:hypothetical protein
MRMNEDNCNVKSIHIFAWPFYFVKAGSSKQIDNPSDMGDILKYFKSQGSSWNEYKMDKGNPCDYMLDKYMTKSARDIFEGNGDNWICRRFIKCLHNNFYYLCGEADEKKEYKLPIKEIELHIYRFGFGVMFIRAENDVYTDICDIKRINDWGRRVELPIKVENNISLCAESIGILPDHVAEVDNNNAKFLKDTIFDSKGFGWDVMDTSDDRMFLMCLIKDNKLSNNIEQSYGKNDKLDNDLYCIIFADPDAPTCQNKDMRRKLIEAAVDPRWSDYGTIHAATNTTMFCITSERCTYAPVIRPFIVEYMYLLSLVIAQRLGINAFSVKAGELVNGVDRKGLIRTRQVKKLINLQEQYVTFENQMMILKFTNQDQGIELYNKLQKQLQVKKEQKLLDTQLESLYEITNVSNGNKIQTIGIKIAVVAIIADYSAGMLYSSISHHILFGFILAGIAGTIFLVSFIK